MERLERDFPEVKFVLKANIAEDEVLPDNHIAIEEFDDCAVCQD